MASKKGRLLLNPILLFLLLTISMSDAVQEADKPIYNLDSDFVLDKAGTALHYVEEVSKSECTPGTSMQLSIEFNYSSWSEIAMIAVRSANFLTSQWLYYNGTPPYVTDDFFFAISRTNVESDPRTFGCMVAFGEYIYKDYRQFCSYAFKKQSRINVHDISVEYKFLDNSQTEWWWHPYNQSYDNLHTWNVYLRPRYNSTGNTHGKPRTFIEPFADLDDGHWTKPYFDCGGGDIWMVTYSAPIFRRKFNTVDELEFIGIVGLDVHLSNIDIDQCDLDENDTETTVDVFRGTHRCRESTKCVRVYGMGFKRGSYICECLNGFYFSDQLAEHQYFNGTDIEEAYVEWIAGTSERYLKDFSCVPCPPGCDTCVDNTPCLVEWNFTHRAIYLAIICFSLLLTLCFVLITRSRQELKVFKASSPVFLYIMCLGSALLCVMGIIMYFRPTYALCLTRIWVHYIGFFLLYGALLLKTWRIANIFRVKSARPLRITDGALLKWFLPIIVSPCLYLVIWCVSGHAGDVTVVVTNSGLKYEDCIISWWDHAGTVARFLFLLWGVYLCFIVRKAPSSFNESKFISWSIYNTVIVGTFLIIIRMFVAISYGPDMSYMVFMLELQIQVTVTQCLIFLPKIYLAASGHGNDVDHSILDNMTNKMRRSNQVTPSVVMPSTVRGQTSLSSRSHLSPKLSLSQVVTELEHLNVCKSCIEKIRRQQQEVKTVSGMTALAPMMEQKSS